MIGVSPTSARTEEWIGMKGRGGRRGRGDRRNYRRDCDGRHGAAEPLSDHGIRRDRGRRRPTRRPPPPATGTWAGRPQWAARGRRGSSVVEHVVQTRQAVFRRQLFALHLRQGDVVDRKYTQFGIQHLLVELLV